MSNAPGNRRVIENLLRNAERLGLSRSARLRLKWFVFAAAHEWNVSKTCRHFGIARTTFVRWAGRFNPFNPASLEEQSRRPRTLREANEDPAVVAFIEQCRRGDPYICKEVLCVRLQAERGIAISVSTVGRIIQRHGLFFGTTPAHREKRRRFAEGEGGYPFFESVPAFGI